MKKWQVLTLRDFFTSREKIILLGIIFLLEVPFSFILNDGMIWVYIVIYLLAIMGMHTDEDQGVNRLFASLPVKRETWVISRYVSSLSIVAICTVILVIESWLLLNMKLYQVIIDHPRGISSLFKIDDFFVGLFLVLLFIAVSFPFYFKWGYTKGLITGAIVSSLVMGVFIGTFYMVMGIRDGIWEISSYIENQEGNRLVAFLAGVGVKAFQELGSATIGIMMLVFIIIAGMASYRISLKIHLSRDL